MICCLYRMVERLTERFIGEERILVRVGVHHVAFALGLGAETSTMPWLSSSSICGTYEVGTAQAMSTSCAPRPASAHRHSGRCG